MVLLFSHGYIREYENTIYNLANSGIASYAILTYVPQPEQFGSNGSKKEVRTGCSIYA